MPSAYKDNSLAPWEHEVIARRRRQGESMQILLQHLRTLRLAAWLGWQIESNWTDPWLFTVYMLIKPFTGSLLLVCMYWAARTATGGAVSTSFLPFLYVSNACYMLVGAVMFGMSWAVISDREHYGMLKYVYISPVQLRSYLVGRGAARVVEALLGALLTLGLGLLLYPIFPELSSALGWQRNWWEWAGWLVLFFCLGVAMLIALGLILAGAVLNMGQYGMFLSEGVGGVLYLLSGVVFPIDVLPALLRYASLAMPTTYWLEAMRRVLLGQSTLPSVLSRWLLPELAGALLISTLALGVVAHFFFRWSERRAWRLGRFDEQMGW